jgi:hypothetical protein
MAGSVTMGSVALAALVNTNFLYLTVFSGAMLFQSAFTGFCPPTMLLNHFKMVKSDGTIAWGGQTRGGAKTGALNELVSSLQKQDVDSENEKVKKG